MDSPASESVERARVPDMGCEAPDFEADGPRRPTASTLRAARLASAARVPSGALGSVVGRVRAGLQSSHLDLG
jgi:hypothetical protein